MGICINSYFLSFTSNTILIKLFVIISDTKDRLQNV